ncbi:MAG: hypothetical protein LIO46_01960, partial [Clostridiales bacterium]|nr:hypothetical protein [Clostridiales bacterium]
MTNDYKVQPVSVGQLFLLLFMGRALICLTYIPTLRFGHINGDYLVSILLSVPMLLVLYFCVHRYLKLNHTENLLDVTGARTKLGAKVLAA